MFELEASRSRALQDRDFLRREIDEKGRLGREVREVARAAASKVADLEKEAVDREQRLADLNTRLSTAVGELERALERREKERAAEQEAQREEARVAELLVGIESRRGVLQDLMRRREGVSSGAQELMEGVEGSQLLTELLTVEPGYERALAAALGTIVQAVVLPGSPDAAVALRGSGPREAIWGKKNEGEGSGKALLVDGPLPPGTRDLWELVSGPEAVIATLKVLTAPTAVLTADAACERGDGRVGAGMARGHQEWRGNHSRAPCRAAHGGRGRGSHARAQRVGHCRR